MPRTRAAAPTTPALDIDELIADPATHIVVCCGSGGVGKTTTAAAIALRGAEAGRRVVVLTIDPARRLAQALGLEELDNTPRPVELPGPAGGSLDAMMLDMKRTFDEVVQAHAAPDKAEQILANPFYQAVSSSFAGTQEYMAMERLGQLHAQRRDGADGAPTWDLIVVDTPPSRSALDFLDAPQRLGSFLDGRFVRLLSAPARAGGRAYLKVFSAGVNVVTNTLTKVLGGQLLRDVQTFVAALDTVFGGFRKRADQTYALLQQNGTAFVVVAVPEHDALREAAYFVDRLDEDGMPLAGLVLNRVRVPAVPSLSAGRALAAAEALEELEPSDTSATTGVTAALLRLHADLAQAAARHQALARRFSSAHPGVPVVQVPAAAEDIHDLTGLRSMGAALAGGD
ncbi:MAG TPA: ArsA family ATPase [Segeticoccus sp.]|uniref:ArsA family ATPase n=1 Tax=Segeticoccus sp. TaxID=2706531 RepID=UPI002D80C044|nr:ArsA family ATPase [Segeticoccus sp.]HET8599000.1 ArsA family ATPase [Segeticoccus sp.]